MAETLTQSAADAEDVDHGRRFLFWWLGISIVATPLVAIFLGPAIPPGHGTVEAAGQVVDNTVLVAISTPVCAFVLVMLAYTLTKFRSRAGVLEDGEPIRGNNRIQVLWVAITTVTVLFLAGFGSYELVSDGAGGGQGPSAAFTPVGYQKALDVQVIGQQWQFTYRYPSAGGVETPDLVLPENTLVRFHVTSLDAIHSFWAYELGVKADANPGVDNIAYVTTKGPLTFHVRCAELCGLWHGYMDDVGHVVSQSDFSAFLAKEKAVYAPIMKYLPPYAKTYLPDPQQRAG
ncbi:MAG TPA: cytochrome c oxidase subunit II [Gaiellaceae bacterium]|jgi:cytochrome c oxidase subunit 2